MILEAERRSGDKYMNLLDGAAAHQVHSNRAAAYALTIERLPYGVADNAAFADPPSAAPLRGTGGVQAVQGLAGPQPKSDPWILIQKGRCGLIVFDDPDLFVDHEYW